MTSLIDHRAAAAAAAAAGMTIGCPSTEIASASTIGDANGKKRSFCDETDPLRPLLPFSSR